MRSNDQLLDISDRTSCGYVISQQEMTEKRETQMTNPKYDHLFKGYTLLLALNNLSLTLADRNHAADKLTREGFVVKQQVDELYWQEDYSEDYVDFEDS